MVFAHVLTFVAIFHTNKNFVSFVIKGIQGETKI